MTVEKRKSFPDFLISQFRHETERMLAERLKLESTPLPNPTDVGGQLESLVRKFVATHLPGRFAVANGYVLNNFGVVSRQQDVMIYDKLEASNFAATEEYSVIPIEYVYATIEVKANLSRSTLADANGNAASVKNLRGALLLVNQLHGEIEEVKMYGADVYTGLFAFDTDCALTTIADTLSDTDASLDHVCILGKTNIVWTTEEKTVKDGFYALRTGPKEQDKCDHIAIMEPKSIENAGLPLFFFLSEIRDYVIKQSTIGRAAKLHEYMNWPKEGMSIQWKNKKR